MKEEQPWETLGISIAEYKKQICHDDIVILGVEVFSRAEARLNNFTKEIKENWGIEWRSHIKDMLPPQDTEHAVATMRRISIKMPIHTFQENLAAAIKERLDNWRSGRRTTNLATVTDLHTVEKMSVKMKTSNDATATATTATTTTATTATATTATAITAIATISTATESPPLKRRRLRTLSEGQNESENESENEGENNSNEGSEDSVTNDSNDDETPPHTNVQFPGLWLRG